MHNFACSELAAAMWKYWEYLGGERQSWTWVCWRSGHGMWETNKSGSGRMETDVV